MSARQEELKRFVALALQCPSDLEATDRTNLAGFQRLRHFEWANCTRDLRTAAEGLDDDALWHLLKVVILAERDFRWSGGSAASGVWLYTMLCERRPAAQREIADWVFCNRGDNPYVPLGTALSRARSWEDAQQELREIDERRATRRTEGELRQQAQENGAAERMERHLIQAAEHRARSATNSEQRRALLDGLAEMGLADLVRVFLNWPLPISSFPLTVLVDNRLDYSALPRETLRKLRAAVGRRRGRWRELVEMIDDALREPSLPP